MMRCLLFFLLLTGLVACAPVLRPTVVPSDVSEEELLQIVFHNADSFSSLKGLARVSLEEEGKKTIKGKQVLLVKKSGQIRTEILGLFGQPAAVVVVDGGDVAILVPGEAVLYRGEASPQNVQRILRIPLQVTDLVSFILYQVPLMEYQRTAMETLPDGEVRLILYGKGGVREDLYFDLQKRLIGAVFMADSEALIDIRYADFSEDEKMFPRVIRLGMPSRKIEVSVEFSSVRTNLEIKDDLFHLQKPEGFQVLPVP